MTSTNLMQICQSAEKYALLLNSGNGWMPEKETFTFFKNPVFTLFFQDNTIILESGTRKLKLKGNPLSILENFLARGYLAVGYLGYEFFKFIEPNFAPDPRKKGASLPDACFMFFEDKDAVKGKVDDLLNELEDTNSQERDPITRPNLTKSDFMRMVERVREYIKKGDVYEVNLSQRFEAPFETSPLTFLAKLYNIQPVPFACCLNFGNFQLLSGSMELFLRRIGRRLVTRPIKGTRRRGINEVEDKALKEELFTSEKERAENLMIVDLMRNDLGRVCEYGSVRVNKLFEIEPYSTLYQMVSEVEGKLRDGVGIKDILRNTFPPGSITGAPKRRAMEIIDELEPHLRAPYCGATCLFLPDGDFTLSVAIRVLTAFGNRCTFWVGGGITWGSEPEQEYEETLIKARAMMKALR